MSAAAQSRGADPSIRTEDYDPYLNPGHHLPIDIACEDETVRAKLLALDKKYAATPKVMPVHRADQGRPGSFQRRVFFR